MSQLFRLFKLYKKSETTPLSKFFFLFTSAIHTFLYKCLRIYTKAVAQTNKQRNKLKTNVTTKLNNDYFITIVKNTMLGNSVFSTMGKRDMTFSLDYLLQWVNWVILIQSIVI